MMGIGNAGMWGPLATTATRNLPMRQAGAGAGIYNTTRTVGSVIGSAAIAAFMQSRLEANLPGAAEAAGSFGGGTLPAFVVDGFSTAMAQAILLPAAVDARSGVVAVLFLRRPTRCPPRLKAEWHEADAEAPASADRPARSAVDDVLRDRERRRRCGEGRRSGSIGDLVDGEVVEEFAGRPRLCPHAGGAAREVGV